MDNTFCVLLKRNALIMLLLYMFVISLNLFIMYQSYGGSKLNLMRGEVTGSKTKWGETGGYRHMKDNIKYRASTLALIIAMND